MTPAINEDSIPREYKYFWDPSSAVSLDDFLSKNKPSMIKNDGTKPWIWVRRTTQEPSDDGLEDAQNQMKGLLEAQVYLLEITTQVENIKNDPSIPVRSNKKTGAKSKKEVREELQAEAAKKLKSIALEHNYLTGKWLLFSSSDRVDGVWSTIAKSLTSGPLQQTLAYCAKVATLPPTEQPHYQHVICLYLPNIYDADEARKVMKVLLADHGLSLSGCKSDLNTAIGLDSKHPSGVPSTVWKNTTLLPEDEIKRLKEGHWQSVQQDNKAKAAADKEAAGRAKLTTKKKADSDPFDSDEDEEPGSKPLSKPPTAPVAEVSDPAAKKPNPKGEKRKQDEVGAAEHSEEPRKKKAAKKKVF